MMTNKDELAEKRVYTIYEVAKLLNISVTFAYSLVNLKKFKFIKVGNRYRISKISFDKWLEEGGNT